MAEKIPTLKILNQKQKEEVREVVNYYKYIYLCNSCGTLYGSDLHEKLKLCPVCELKLKRKKKNE